MGRNKQPLQKEGLSHWSITMLKGQVHFSVV
jgi:hypothetical protein